MNCHSFLPLYYLSPIQALSKHLAFIIWHLFFTPWPACIWVLPLEQSGVPLQYKAAGCFNPSALSLSPEPPQPSPSIIHCSRCTTCYQNGHNKALWVPDKAEVFSFLPLWADAKSSEVKMICWRSHRKWMGEQLLPFPFSFNAQSSRPTH